MPRREHDRQLRFAAEGIKAERDAAVKSAIKAKMPLYDITEAFGLSEAEIGDILQAQNSGPRGMSDILDARTEPPRDRR